MTKSKAERRQEARDRHYDRVDAARYVCAAKVAAAFTAYHRKELKIRAQYEAKLAAIDAEGDISKDAEEDGSVDEGSPERRGTTTVY